MARWIQNEPNGSSTSQRRKWNLDGKISIQHHFYIFQKKSFLFFFYLILFVFRKDRTSLRNLHGNMMANGDSNSQYEIAKQILENDSGKHHKSITSVFVAALNSIFCLFNK